MSFKVGSITFPLVYEQVVNDNPAFYKEGDGLPGVLPLLAAIGKKARKITASTPARHAPRGSPGPLCAATWLGPRVQPVAGGVHSRHLRHV